ncbi:Trihelix transcription factor df1 [Ancistrocladus abbreviatus]
MLGTSSGLLGSSGNGSSSGGAAASAAAQAHESGAASSTMAAIAADEGRGLRGDEFEDRGCGAGYRWPRQETLALIKIRHDMDVVFRDSSLKGPLWEEVSRKMAELGYHRSAKKCKEKFENVYKYHKRTKEGRAGKPDGKTYRFFDQLEALENHPAALPPLPPPHRPPPHAAVPVSVAMPPSSTNQTASTAVAASVPQATVPSTTNPANIIPVVATPQMNPTNPLPAPQPQPPPQPSQPVSTMQMSTAVLHSHQNQIIQPSLLSRHQVPSTPSSSPSSSSSSSTSSDEEILGRRKRKRKWKDFFERLMKEVIDKQEELQRKFLEAIEKREHDRIVREEAWKLQEMARLNREHEILVQERSVAAAKDTALIAFLQKLSDQQQIPLPQPFSQTQTQTHPSPSPAPTTVQPLSQPQPQQPPQVQENLQVSLPPPQPQLQSQPQLQPPPPVTLPLSNVHGPKSSNGENPLPAGSSRWPRAEVQALIKLRTNLDQKYQESGPKGPLWEEISASMRKLGYNRSSKRCKEKWENINKYFKKVKESNKMRKEDSKTCPYFHQLDQLYREKNNNTKMDSSINPNNARPAVVEAAADVGSMAAPIMAQPERQWPLPPEADQNPGSDNADLNYDDDDGDDDEDDDQGYELVANNNVAAASMGGGEGGGATTATTAAMENS